MAANNSKQNSRLNKVLSLPDSPSRSVKSAAQERLSAILDAEPIALISANRLLSGRVKPVPIAYLDRLLERSRRGPRQAKP